MSRYYAEQARASYDRARRQAILHAILARLCRRPNSLLSYHEVRRHLVVAGESYRGLRTVQVIRIVGSTDRAGDFDRAFRPRQCHTAARWQSVARAHDEGRSLPPVQLYQVGGAYFVRDGHHRVSVARARGQIFVDAEVVEVVEAGPPAVTISAPPAALLGSPLAESDDGRARPNSRLLAGLRVLARGRDRPVPGARGA